MKKAVLTLILFIAFLNTQAQQKINLVVNSYYIVQETATGDTIHSAASEREAIERYINYVNRTGSKTAKIFYPNEMRIDITGTPQAPEMPQDSIVIDTFTTIADYILLDYTDSLVQPTEESQKWALILNQGLHEIQADTIHRWQSIFKLERTRTFGQVKYKSLDIPFQFVSDTITYMPGQTHYRFQTFATKKHCVKYYLNNVYTGDADISCNPGTINYHGVELRRHTNDITGLEPGTEYLIRVEGTSEFGEFDFIEFTVITNK